MLFAILSVTIDDCSFLLLFLQGSSKRLLLTKNDTLKFDTLLYCLIKNDGNLLLFSLKSETTSKFSKLCTFDYLLQTCAKNKEILALKLKIREQWVLFLQLQSTCLVWLVCIVYGEAEMKKWRNSRVWVINEVWNWERSCKSLKALSLLRVLK